MITQQVGAVCFLSCWCNYDILKNLRSRHDGQLLNADQRFFEPGLAKTRLEWFLETAEPIAKWYEIFRAQKNLAGSPFNAFIERVKTTSIRVEDGENFIGTLEPIDQCASSSFFPHLLSSESESLEANGLYSQHSVSRTSSSIPMLGQNLFYTPQAMFEENMVFYNFGLYKLMLMAAKINKNNDIVANDALDLESLEILQFHKAIKNTPNPWSNINREHFLEYRVANLFKNDSVLKEKAKAVVDVFFKTFDFYETARKTSGLAEKMQDFSGEEQILSYCFCQSLRKLSAASISEKAMVAVLELTDEKAEQFSEMLNITNFSEMFKSKLLEKRTIASGDPVCFADVWAIIKGQLNLADGTDMVTFSGHGAVLSFDSKVLAVQTFEDRGLAQFLGFVTLDSSYAKSLNPFYQLSD